MLIVKIIMASLATYRLSLLFSKEIGPWGVFEKIRRLPREGSYLRKGLGCIMCESVYWSFVSCAILAYGGDIPGYMFPIYCMAISGIAIIINDKFPYKE